MQTQFLVINLYPDFAIMASLVVVAHWVWLFALKDKMKAVASKKSGLDGGMDPIRLSDIQNDSLIPPSSTNGLYSSVTEEGVEKQSIEVAESQSRETVLKEKYANVDMVATLEALQQGTLTVESKRELQELALLTLSTEEKYPNPIDMELKRNSPVKEYLN